MIQQQSTSSTKEGSIHNICGYDKPTDVFPTKIHHIQNQISITSNPRNYRNTIAPTKLRETKLICREIFLSDHQIDINPNLDH